MTRCFLNGNRDLQNLLISENSDEILIDGYKIIFKSTDNSASSKLPLNLLSLEQTTSNAAVSFD